MFTSLLTCPLLLFFRVLTRLLVTRLPSLWPCISYVEVTQRNILDELVSFILVTLGKGNVCFRLEVVDETCHALHRSFIVILLHAWMLSLTFTVPVLA